MKEFWKSIAPEEWKTHKKRKDKKKNGKSQTKENKRSKRKRKDEYETFQCVDPFHFLQKCDNLSKERPTKCSCSRFKSPKKSTKYKNIKSFLTSIPTLCPMSTNEMDFILGKHNVYNRNNHFSTKESNIRDQHDRGKKRKQQK